MGRIMYVKLESVVVPSPASEVHSYRSQHKFCRLGTGGSIIFWDFDEKSVERINHWIIDTLLGLITILL